MVVSLGDCRSPIVAFGHRLSILSGGGEVVLQWGEEVANDGDTPRSPQQLVSPMTTEIGNVGVVVRKAKESSRKKTDW